jgi:hypothetical protein
VCPECLDYDKLLQPCLETMDGNLRRSLASFMFMEETERYWTSRSKWNDLESVFGRLLGEYQGSWEFRL